MPMADAVVVAKTHRFAFGRARVQEQLCPSLLARLEAGGTAHDEQDEAEVGLVVA